MKRLAIVGKGTAGALAASYFSLRMPNDEVFWYYDPQIKTQAVGEGATPHLSKLLYDGLGFLHEDLPKIYGTFKTGIEKEGWGSEGKMFIDPFPGENIAYHFNAIALQDYIFNKLKNRKNVKFIKQNVIPVTIDADYIMDCSGVPKSYEDYIEPNTIPVNSVYVTQCYWDYPKFQHTKAIAKKYGWVFLIPLTNRCSVGYLYNKGINNIEEIKEDVQELFERYNLTPSNDTNNFAFNNYYKKNNFSKRISYNGNASFFLEPLEATSIQLMYQINQETFDIINKNLPYESQNESYLNNIEVIQNFLMMHYLAGSKYKSEFWDFAYERAYKHFEKIKNNKGIRLTLQLFDIKDNDEIHYRLQLMARNMPLLSNFNFFSPPTYYYNVLGLGVKDKLIEMGFADVAQG